MENGFPSMVMDIDLIREMKTPCNFKNINYWQFFGSYITHLVCALLVTHNFDRKVSCVCVCTHTHIGPPHYRFTTTIIDATNDHQ